MAAQAAHIYCRWYSFLLPGYKPHFFSNLNSFKISNSFFTNHLVKNCSEKKKVWRHGRLWRPTWTDWLKKGPTMQVRSFMELKNVINLKCWHSIPPLKIGEILNIFWRWRDFYNPYCTAECRPGHITLKSDEWSLIFWVEENECRAKSELSKNRVRPSLKATAQFKRACILSSSLSDVFLGQYIVKIHLR